MSESFGSETDRAEGHLQAACRANAEITRLKQAIVDNCPHSMVQCGCGLYYKQAGEETCTVCKIRKLEVDLAASKTEANDLRQENAGLKQEVDDLRPREGI
jgi:hypothetical protein